MVKRKYFKCDFCKKRYTLRLDECFTVSFRHVDGHRETYRYSPHPGFCKKCITLLDELGYREFCKKMLDKKLKI